MAQERDAAPSEESSPLGVPTSSSSTGARSLGRRSVRTASTSDNPLAASDTPLGLSSSPTTSGQYAVYSGSKKRSSILGGTTYIEPPTAESSTTATASPSPASPSTPSTPPFAPTAQPSVPPLVSRPSNSTLPTTSGRPYARSVSEARSMLQGQVLRSEVQSLGLGNESTGTAMVQKLAGLGSEPEWAQVLKVLATGKVTLLLPAEKMLPTMQLTPGLFLDHSALFESPSPSSEDGRGGFATLSGFRGRNEQGELIFASCGEVASASRRTAAPDYSDRDVQRSISGPPLSALSSGSPFPSTMLISSPSSLSIPRTIARPSTPSSSSTLGRASAGSRLAALFAKPVVAPNESDLPPIVPAPAGLLDGKTADSTTSEASTLRPQVPNLEIPVLAVGKIVRHAELIKSIGKALDVHLRSQLKSIEGCDDAALLDRVSAFAAKFQPPSAWSSADEMCHAYQDLADAIRLDLNRTLKAQLVKEKRKGRDTEAVENELEQEDYVALEEKADASLEQVEEIITSSLYDRLFSPSVSGDAQEDENLASRIGALNVLELTLEHLGVDLSSEKSSDEWGAQSKPITDALEDVTRIVGRELNRLEDPLVRTPKAKLDVFVNLHKIIVDHLSNLPPIPLKKELSAAAAAKGRPAEMEMDDASLRTGNSRSSSRPASPPPPSSGDESLLRTPRPPIDGDGDVDSSVPDISLPHSGLASSVHEATSCSLFDSPKPTPPPSVFDSSASSLCDGASSPSQSNSSSADLILPLLIYAVVQHNPHLPSHLKYAQRFRAESLLRGESSYCSTNMQAVIEFLNTVDVSSLGLNSQKVLAFSSSSTSSAGAPVSRSRSSTLSFGVPGRKSVTITPSSRSVQEIDQFVDSANHALVRAADLLFGPKGLGRAPRTIEDVRSVLDGAGSVASKARGTLLRRATASSVVPPPAATEEGKKSQKEMVDFVPGSGDAFDQGTTEEYSAQAQPPLDDSDARSVRSLLSTNRKVDAPLEDGRPSLGDRLASIPGLGRFAGEKAVTISGGSATPNGGQRTSLFSAFSPGSSPVRQRSSTAVPSPLASPAPSTFSFFAPASSIAASTSSSRFLDPSLSAEDLRLGEVAELLREYRRVVGELETLKGASAE